MQEPGIVVKRDLTEVTGSFGRWQKLIFASVFYISVIGVWQNLSITFLAPNVPFRCVNSSEQCVIEVENVTQPCTEWDYDTSFYSETIVSEWDLVCDREWLISMAKSIYMVGFLISVITFGQISDWIGRYPVLFICYVITVASMFLSLFSTSYLMFLVFRFFQAFGRTGLTTTGYVLLMEVVGEKHREAVGIGVQLGWSLGFASLAGVAYVFRHWFWFQLAMAIPILPIAFAFWVIPESPRWLLMQGKVKKLESILKKAAEMNGKEYKLQITDLDQFRNNSQENQKSLLDLFKTPTLRKRILCMFYLWMVNSFMYYGLSYNTNDLAGDPYINFTLAGALEFPSYAVLFWGVKKLGRRPTFVGFMIVGGIACVLMAVDIPSIPWMRTSLAMAGKFCVTSSFGLLYLYTTEIFPTVVRNVAVGSSSMMARIGSIMAPFVKELGRATYPWVPDVVYGLLAISGGLLAFLLPETKGKSIPDTLDEGENFAQSELRVGVNQVSSKQEEVKY